MPNRIIKESICTSEDINNMTWFEECFYTRLIVNCDDYGRLDARPAILKAKLFPLKDRLTIKDVESALEKLACIGCVKLYVCDGKPYLYIPAWEVHQTIRNHKSKYPEPDLQAIDFNCKQMISIASKCSRNPIQSESNPNPNPNTESRAKYGEFKNVLLSAEEYEKLKSQYPDYEQKIYKLSEYMARTGKSYKSHYLTILCWARNDEKKEGKSDNIFLEMLKEEQCKEQIL